MAKKTDNETEEKQKIEEEVEEQTGGFELKYFIEDIKELIIHPKETARHLADAPCIPLAFISLFLVGCSMGMRKLMSARESLNMMTGTGAISTSAQTISELGLRDAQCITPFLLPIVFVLAWYLAAFAINFFAEKAGGYSGSYSDILSVLGYFGIELLIFEGCMLVLFLIGTFCNLHFMNIIINILYFIFAIWFLFAGTFCVEAIYEMPMSYSGMIFWGVILAIYFCYYIAVDMILEKFVLVEILKGKYAISK